MPNPLVAIPAAIGAAGSIGGALISSGAGASAAESQRQSTELGIEEQRRQFDFQKELLQPFVSAGSEAQREQLALLGLGEEGAEQAAIDRITGGSQFQELVSQQEAGLLSNQAATGGLRGGNTQRALAQIRPSILNNLIASRQNALGGLSAQGQNAAVGTATFSQNVANQVTDLRAQEGAATAGNALAQGRIGNQLIGNLSQTIGQVVPQIPGIRNSF